MVRTTAAAMGWLRTAVGVVLIVGPEPFLRLSERTTADGVSVLLLRTIGIRDLVMGLGTVDAAWRGTDQACRRWICATLASDALDVAASLASGRAIGRTESLGAAGTALACVLGDLAALRTLPAGRTG